VFDLGAAFDDAMRAEKNTEDKQEGAKESSPIEALKKSLQGATATPFQDDPAAHTLYNQMVETMRKAESLSFVSHYTFEAKDRVLGDCTYRVWLKKPNYFRVEAESTPEKRGGILIGDGSTLWIYWPGGRPQFVLKEEESEADQKTRLSSYMKKPAPAGGHSIGHEVCYLGAGMSMPIIDPSTFHGYTDSLQPYLDGVKNLGVEKLGDEECDKIEVSIMKHQRSWFLWLSKSNHLPLKLKEIVRVSYDLIINEEWSSINLNAEISEKQFAWKPPEGWTQWKMPKPEERLLKPGAKAPDFELASADGTQIKLSDYRGKVVWLYIWRAG
jgi:outer membrane lipoprotein-sorting protein